MTSATSRASTSSQSITATARSATAKRFRKQCTAADCSKVDAGGGYCVAHGGGKKCAFPGCHKGYQTGGFCRQHGGGARCQVEGCGKVDAGRGLCRGHGGGKRCQETGCSKADVGGGFCTAHGGGKRCSEPGCTKIDQGGGKCRAHGGARRCRHDGCKHPARGASGHCSDHGGAQLCTMPNCRRLAKAEGGKYCTSCAKSQAKSDVDDDEPMEPYDVDQKRMPPFVDMLARTSPRTEYSPMMVDSMEPFRAFVEAATTADITSPPQYSDDVHVVRSPQLLMGQSPTEGYESHDDAPRNYASCLDNGCSKTFGGRCNCQSGCSCTDTQAENHPEAPSNYGSCLDNGCSKTFGGRCNCETGCSCSTTQEENHQETPRNYGSCLDNGCSKSFGGRCNCKTGCTCCSPSRGTERNGNETPDEVTPESTTLSAETKFVPSFLQLQRVTIIIRMCTLPVAIVRSVLKGVDGVRSVHIKPQDSSLDSTDESASDENASLTVVLRCDPQFTVDDIAVLAQLSIQYDVQESSTVGWSLKEVVLRVADMMCPGNCGRTVINALLPMSTIQTANLVFDERCVVARGVMDAKQLCDAIEAVGFEPEVIAELPLPKRFIFRVVDFASVHLIGGRLRDMLQEVEGVETVLLAVNRAELLIEATLRDAGCLLQAAHANGIVMVETQEDVRDIQTSPLDPTHLSRSSQPPSETAQSGPSEENDHVCDVKVCPHNGCEQYMVTVAHTAALAVGWSVPGCAMGWGGECTCGEKCKCAGCPEHNPLT